MRVIYILGLEHSGTTLTDQLLSGCAGVVGLGEVAGYFSPQHMRNYHERWGHLPDAYQCSCNKMFDQCEFWRHLQRYSGLNSQAYSYEKYHCLANTAENLYGGDVVLVDSSKSISGLNNWRSYVAKSSGALVQDVRVVFAVKDARSFAASMIRKNQTSPNATNFMLQPILNVVRHFNYWVGANQELKSYLLNEKIDYRLSIYEELCNDPAAVLAYLARGVVDTSDLVANIDHSDSHIGIGNKSFIMRNRKDIVYDDSWRKHKALKLIYSMHASAKKMNRDFHSSFDLSC